MQGALEASAMEAPSQAVSQDVKEIMKKYMETLKQGHGKGQQQVGNCGKNKKEKGPFPGRHSANRWSKQESDYREWETGQHPHQIRYRGSHQVEESAAEGAPSHRSCACLPTQLTRPGKDRTMNWLIKTNETNLSSSSNRPISRRIEAEFTSMYWWTGAVTVKTANNVALLDLCVSKYLLKSQTNKLMRINLFSRRWIKFARTASNVANKVIQMLGLEMTKMCCQFMRFD